GAECDRVRWIAPLADRHVQARECLPGQRATLGVLRGRQERQPERGRERRAGRGLVGPHAVPLALVRVELVLVVVVVGLGLAIERQGALLLVGIVRIVLGRIVLVVLDAGDRRAWR